MLPVNALEINFCLKIITVIHSKDLMCQEGASSPPPFKYSFPFFWLCVCWQVWFTCVWATLKADKPSCGNEILCSRQMAVFTAQALLGLAHYKRLLSCLEKTLGCAAHTEQILFRSINFTRFHAGVRLSLSIRWKPLISHFYFLNSYVLLLMYG